MVSIESIKKLGAAVLVVFIITAVVQELFTFFLLQVDESPFVKIIELTYLIGALSISLLIVVGIGGPPIAQYLYKGGSF